MEDEKVLLLRSHPCCFGLGDGAVGEIAEAAEVLRYEAGEEVYNQGSLTSVYLIVEGRLKVKVLAVHGHEPFAKFLTPGDQFGGLAASLEQTLPMRVVAHDPSTLLKIDYQAALALMRRHERFRSNFARLIANSARDAFFGSKKRNRPFVVGVVHESPSSRDLTVRLIRRLVELGEAPCVLSDRKHPISIDGIEHRPLLEDGEFLSEEAILEQTHDWSDSDRVLVDLDVTNDLVGVTNVVKNCDQVFWCLEPDQSELAAAHLTEIERHAPASREKISIAWLLKGDDEVVPLTPRLRALSSEDYKLSLEEPGPTVGRALTNGFERVIHQLRGIRIGVALGGGAARGMAHLGVLKALEESGIVVDMIAGSSAGAMTGTLMAAGLDAGEITESFVRDLEPPWLFRILPRGSHWYLLYKYRTGRFDPMLRVYLKHRQLEQLPIPMSSIAVDLISGDVVVRDDGDAVHSVIDSINLPILSAPICRQGRVLVDGGLVNNIPADVLVGKGCNFVIAVSVTAELGDEFGGNRASTPTKEMKTPSTLQTILRSYLLQSRNNSSVGVELADVVIEPDVTMFDISEFTRADELAAIGEQTTVEAVPRIKELLAQLDSEMFSGNGAQSRTDSESRPSTGEAILDHDLAQK